GRRADAGEEVRVGVLLERHRRQVAAEQRGGGGGVLRLGEAGQDRRGGAVVAAASAATRLGDGAVARGQRGGEGEEGAGLHGDSVVDVKSGPLRQHRTPPASGEGLVTSRASRVPSAPHDQGAPSAWHRSLEKRSSGAQDGWVTAAPRLPQPNRSFSPPSPHSAAPGPLWRVAKKTGTAGSAVAAAQEPPLRAPTSAAPTHTCQPSAHRSATLQPSPDGLSPSSPAARAHAGSMLVNRPGSLQPPAQAAMSGLASMERKPSRMPSAQPLRAAAGSTAEASGSPAGG